MLFKRNKAKRKYSKISRIKPINRKVNYRQAQRATRSIKRITRKEPFIPEIRGIVHLNFLEKLRGSRDCRNQEFLVVEADDGSRYVTSAAIEIKVADMERVLAKQYQKIGANLDKVTSFVETRVNDISRNKERRAILDDPELHPYFENAESKLRHKFQMAEEKEFLAAECIAIQEELNVIKGQIEDVNDQMKSLRDVAVKAVEENITKYYAGALRANRKYQFYTQPDLPLKTNYPMGTAKDDGRLKRLIEQTEKCLAQFNV